MAGGDLTAQVGLAQGSNFSDMGPETAILVVACDLEEEAPLYWLRVKQAADRGAKLIVLNPRPTKTDRYATQIIRYPYGSEAAAVLEMVNSLSAKRPELPEDAKALSRGPALQEAARIFAEAENAVILYGSEGTSLEASAALAQACANLLIATNHIGRVNNGLIGVWQRANEQGAWDLGFRPVNDLAAAMKAAKALYIVGADPAGDDPSLAESADFLVVQELSLTQTARLADVVLPVQSFTEREGSYTNGERRVQRFYPAVPEPAGILPDSRVTAEIGRRLGLDLEMRSASRVMDRIAQAVPDYAGLSYRKLAEVEEQWPIIGREDLYYGGTGYENSQGMGYQLAPAAQKSSPALGWVQPPVLERPANGFLAVPFTRLYDKGQTLLASTLLQERIPDTFVMLNPADAERLGAVDGDTVQVLINGMDALAAAKITGDVPEGIVLVPRSYGIPIVAPVPVQLKLAEPALA